MSCDARCGRSTISGVAASKSETLRKRAWIERDAIFMRQSRPRDFLAETHKPTYGNVSQTNVRNRNVVPGGKDQKEACIAIHIPKAVPVFFRECDVHSFVFDSENTRVYPSHRGLASNILINRSPTIDRLCTVQGCPCARWTLPSATIQT